MLRLRSLPFLLALALGGALGCASAPGATVQQLQTRAVFDLGCPHHQLMLYHIDGRTKAVAGCGRRLVYVQSCQRIRGQHECTWVLNTPTFAQTQWPAHQRSTHPPGYVFVGERRTDAQGRPVATELFDPRGLPVPTRTRWPTTPPSKPAAKGPAAPAGTQAPIAPARGASGRASPTDLFGTRGQPGPGTPGATRPAGRHMPTELFEPNEL